MAQVKTPSGRTAERTLRAALDAFGTRGYGATSLDDLARELGIRKQTILYWYPSKEARLDAVAPEVTLRLKRAVAGAEPGFGRVEAIVKAMFRLAARHPSMLGFLREGTRLGPPGATRLRRVHPPAHRQGGRLPGRGDGRRAHPPPRPPADPAGRLLDGDRAGHRGRGAA